MKNSQFVTLLAALVFGFALVSDSDSWLRGLVLLVSGLLAVAGAIDVWREHSRSTS